MAMKRLSTCVSIWLTCASIPSVMFSTFSPFLLCTRTDPSQYLSPMTSIDMTNSNWVLFGKAHHAQNRGCVGSQSLKIKPRFEGRGCPPNQPSRQPSPSKRPLCPQFLSTSPPCPLPCLPDPRSHLFYTMFFTHHFLVHCLACQIPYPYGRGLSSQYKASMPSEGVVGKGTLMQPRCRNPKGYIRIDGNKQPTQPAILATAPPLQNVRVLPTQKLLAYCLAFQIHMAVTWGTEGMMEGEERRYGGGMEPQTPIYPLENSNEFPDRSITPVPASWSDGGPSAV